MRAQDRYTKIIESLVNGDSASAEDLLHEAFVEKAREIWSDLVEQDEIVEDDIAEEELEEAFGDEESDDFLNDIETADEEIEAEEAFGEAEDEDEGELDADMELAADDGFDAEGDDNGDIGDAITSVEDALADLKAEFAKLMGDDMDDDMDDMDDMDMGDDEEEVEEEFTFEADEEELEEEAGIVVREDFEVEELKPLFVSKGSMNKYYPFILRLTERDYHEVIAKGDGSKEEQMSKSVKVDIKQIGNLNTSDIITEYMLLKLKEYLNVQKY